VSITSHFNKKMLSFIPELCYLKVDYRPSFSLQIKVFGLETDRYNFFETDTDI